MPDSRTPPTDERDHPIPQSDEDRPVHGDKLADPKGAAPEKKKLPRRSHDMDQPGMDPDDEDAR